MIACRVAATALALSGLSACPAARPRAASGRLGERPAVVAPSETPDARESVVPLVEAVPRALDLSIDPRTLSKVRASPRPFATLLEPGSQRPWSDGELRSELSRETVVLDGDRDSTPRRPTLLCDAYSARVVAQVDASGLHSVTVRLTRISPEGSIDNDDARAPGLRLRAGEIVEIRGEPSNGKQHVSYETGILKGFGVIASLDVDLVYTPGEGLPALDAPSTPGVLVRAVDLLDAPRGRAFGRIEPPTAEGEKSPRESVQVLARRSGHCLIFLDLVDVQAIGWVPGSAVRHGKASDAVDVWGGLRSAEVTTIKLVRGTLLRGPSTDRLVGVVKEDGAFACVDGCDGPLPIVVVEACGTDLRVRARLPTAPAPRP